MRIKTIIYDDASEASNCNFSDKMLAILGSDIHKQAYGAGVEIYFTTDNDDISQEGYHHIVMADDTPQAAVDSALSALEYAIHRGHDRLWIHQD